MPEFRKDPIIDRWVILAADRKSRPSDFSDIEPNKNSQVCPFCPGNENITPPEVYALRPNGSPPNSSGWTLRVVPNKFAALKMSANVETLDDGFFKSMTNVGAHEVIIESPDHQTALENLSESQIAACFSTFKERILSLKQNLFIQYVLIFKNQGRAAGATLSHSHCQLVALPLVPELLLGEVEGSRNHHLKTGNCLYCDLIRSEKRQGSRWVVENDSFVAFCPYAPRFPYETWILPKIHQAAYEREQNYHVFANIFKEVLLRIQVVLKNTPYNFILHTAPDPQQDESYFHWHLEILPKVNLIAGFEYGTGAFINHTTPEDAADQLRRIDL